MKSAPTIVLLHATPVAMQPVHAAFEADWPEATLVNLLDDGLTSARAQNDELTEALITRFVNLVRYGCTTGADAVLATCSAFGPAIERAAREMPVPVCKPNDAMYHDALACGERIAMLATFAPSVPTMETEFFDEAARRNPNATLTTVVVDHAIDLLRAGNADEHNRLVAEAAARLSGFDAIMLAHFSTSRAYEACNGVTGIPVFTAPRCAVRLLRQRLADPRNTA